LIHIFCSHLHFQYTNTCYVSRLASLVTSQASTNKFLGRHTTTRPSLSTPLTRNPRSDRAPTLYASRWQLLDINPTSDISKFKTLAQIHRYGTTSLLSVLHLRTVSRAYLLGRLITSPQRPFDISTLTQTCLQITHCLRPRASSNIISNTSSSNSKRDRETRDRARSLASVSAPTIRTRAVAAVGIRSISTRLTKRNNRDVSRQKPTLQWLSPKQSLLRSQAEYDPHWHLFEPFNIETTREIRSPTQIDLTLHEADGRDLLIQSDHSKQP
jgi:hypothetical protein